jgi:hypothetical protein
MRRLGFGNRSALLRLVPCDHGVAAPAARHANQPFRHIAFGSRAGQLESQCTDLLDEKINAARESIGDHTVRIVASLAHEDRSEVRLA